MASVRFTLLRRSALVSSTLLGLACACPAAYAEEKKGGTSLGDFDIEALMNVEVSTVAKRGQKLQNTPAAGFVLTADDIRRSGANSIPEALRMVPGLQVAQDTSGFWAISARGLNSVFSSNKLLVMIDGRSVFNVVFAGVFWDLQTVPLETIEKIEVIRGPGATLWPSNAVNGVINIVTKKATQRSGVAIASTVGTEVRTGFAQVGYAIGKQANLALYGASFLQNQSGGTRVFKAYDQTALSQGGFRFDQVTDATTVTVTGDYRQGDQQNQTFSWAPNRVDRTLLRSDPDPKGAHIKGRVVRKLTSGGELAFGAYHDFSRRKSLVHEESIRTTDYDVQYSQPIGSKNTVMVGAEYRRVADNLIGSHILTFDSQRAISEWYTGFIQDEIRLLDGRLSLLIGSKIERNDFTSTQLQPSVRGLYSLSDNQSVWAALSRVNRTPFRTENGGTLLGGQARTPLGLTGFGVLTGSPGVERWLTYELGYRVKPLSSVSIDATTFITRSHDFDLAVKQSPYLGVYQGQPGVIQPYDFGSYGKVRTMGLELSASIIPAEYAHIQAWYTCLNVDIDSLAVGNFPLSTERTAPRHSGYIRSLINLTEWLDFDTHVRAVGRLQDLPGVHGYAELGTRLAARISPNWELSLGGENLLKRRHLEFADPVIGLSPTGVERSFYARVRYRLGKDF